MSHSLRAVKLYNSGYSCAQSVLGAFHKELNIDFDTAMRMGSSFGGGIARMREVCGTVSAMALIIGMKYGYTDSNDYNGKKLQYETVQMLADKFRNSHKSIICRDLLGEIGKDNAATPGRRTAEYYSNRPCAAFIYTMCEIIDEYISENDNIKNAE